jgi:hypothetical protein
LERPFSKMTMIPRTSIATTRAASPTVGNPSTSLGASCSTIYGLGDVPNTSTVNTPSSAFFFKRGRPRLRSAWPPGGPLDPFTKIGTRKIRIALSKPLRLNGFTARSLGRARLPFCGACSPPCTFLISLMIEGAIASLPAMLR